MTIGIEKQNFDAHDLTYNNIGKNVKSKNPILNQSLNTMKTYLQEMDYVSIATIIFLKKLIFDPFDENIVTFVKLLIEIYN